MHISQCLSIEEFGTNYKNEEVALLKVQLFVDEKPVGNPQIIFSGKKEEAEEIKHYATFSGYVL